MMIMDVGVVQGEAVNQSIAQVYKLSIQYIHPLRGTVRTYDKVILLKCPNPLFPGPGPHLTKSIMYSKYISTRNRKVPGSTITLGQLMSCDTVVIQAFLRCECEYYTFTFLQRKLKTINLQGTL